MGCREVFRLQSAEKCEKPGTIPKSRPRKASKKYGIAFESAVARKTGGIHGQWFRFVDANGVGFCQTDVILVLSGEAVVLECKLTEVGEARKQLGMLYIPVVQKALGIPTKGVVVARHLTRETDRARVVSNLGLAMRAASASYFPTVHWLGRGPI